MSNIFPFENLDESDIDQAPSTLEVDPNLIKNITKLEDLPDGSTIYEFASDPERVNREDDESSAGLEGDNFYTNLAEKLSDSELTGLATKLLDEIDEDKQSRAEWESTIAAGMKYLGMVLKDNGPLAFDDACAAFDTTMTSALFHSYAIISGSLLPASGPVKSQINGVPTEETEDKGARVEMFMNYFLTKMDKGYYPDYKRALLYIIFIGCCFKKVIQDPLCNQPRSRFIKPDDLIININAVDILSSSRITQRIPLNRRDILLKQRNKEYIKFDVPDEVDNEDNESPVKESIDRIDGINSASNEKTDLFDFYECHVDLLPREVEKKYLKKIKNSKIPRPYIVTIFKQLNKVVAIRRNWREEDNKFSRIECFVSHIYLPGFGIYGLGLIHLMGSIQVAITALLRMTINSIYASTFPGGLKKKSTGREEDNNKMPSPFEFVNFDCPDGPIRDNFMLMPYKGPDPIALQLLEKLQQDSLRAPGAADMELTSIGPNTPVGTTMSQLEVASRKQTVVMMNQTDSLGYELQLIFNLFGEYLGDEPYPFAVPGKETYIMKSDFIDSVNIVPVADPNALTSSHKVILAEALLKSATSAPQIHDLREVYKRLYEAMNVQNIDAILPKPPEEPPLSLDPTTENMLMLMGKKIEVAPFQDDDSHITVHNKFIQDNANNPQLLTTVTLHIQQHEASKIIKQIQQSHMEQGVQPPLLTFDMPAIQNLIAQQDAEKTMQQIQAMQQAQAQAQEVNPDILSYKALTADTEQKKEAALLKEKESKLKAETESFKSQLKYESDKDKNETNREIAKERNETSIILETMKHDHQSDDLIKNEIDNLTLE